jgi:hypothetical protein
MNPSITLGEQLQEIDVERTSHTHLRTHKNKHHTQRIRKKMSLRGQKKAYSKCASL